MGYAPYVRIQHNFIRFAFRSLGWTTEPLPPYASRYFLLGLDILSDTRKLLRCLSITFCVGGSSPPISRGCCILRVTSTQQGEMVDGWPLTIA
jgi:hypothetical protein